MHLMLFVSQGVDIEGGVKVGVGVVIALLNSKDIKLEIEF